MRYCRLKAWLLVITLTAIASAWAQDPAPMWNPRTGDAWVDAQLGDINRYGERYRDAFIGEMTRYYGAPRDLVSDLIVNRRWAPGDVYYACSLAQVIGRPCRYVADEWNRDHGEGWGAVAQRLGIKPGSAEFHRLKRGFVPTYERWSRPITLDRDLAADFPNHGKRPRPGTGSVKGGPNKAGPAKPKAPGRKPAVSGNQDKRNGNGNG